MALTQHGGGERQSCSAIVSATRRTDKGEQSATRDRLNRSTLEFHAHIWAKVEADSPAEDRL